MDLPVVDLFLELESHSMWFRTYTFNHYLTLAKRRMSTDKSQTPVPSPSQIHITNHFPPQQETVYELLLLAGGEIWQGAAGALGELVGDSMAQENGHSLWSGKDLRSPRTLLDSNVKWCTATM